MDDRVRDGITGSLSYMKPLHKCMSFENKPFSCQEGLLTNDVYPVVVGD